MPKRELAKANLLRLYAIEERIWGLMGSVAHHPEYRVNALPEAEAKPPSFWLMKQCSCLGQIEHLLANLEPNATPEA